MMSYFVKVSEKGQITLPAEVREKLKKNRVILCK